MKKNMKKVLTMGLVGFTLAGAIATPISAAETGQSETRQTMQAQTRSIASFRTFKVGDGTWAARLTGLPTKTKRFNVWIIRGGKDYLVKSVVSKGSTATLSGGMKDIYDGTNLGRIKAGDKLRIEARGTLVATLIYNVTTSAKY